jgi:23S rRNA pseudouridine1911/1915/1917 synthase
MLNVIYEDKDKIIVNKPAGQLSQSARGFDMDLVSEVLTYRKNKGEEAYAAIINRLDRPVSGLVLIAKNKKEAARLSALMQRESLCKQYLVLVCGRPHSDTGTFTDYLLKNGKDNTSKVVSKEQAGAKKAVLEYSLIDYDEERNVSRLLINLITGRHHQIRVIIKESARCWRWQIWWKPSG